MVLFRGTLRKQTKTGSFPWGGVVGVLFLMILKTDHDFQNSLFRLFREALGVPKGWAEQKKVAKIYLYPTLLD